MASSRWKRFAFFERHTLNLPPEVLEDLIPVDKKSSLSTTTASKNAAAESSRRSLRSLAASTARITENDGDAGVSMVVTTASLPLESKPTTIVAIGSTEVRSSSFKNPDTINSLEAMWSSLTVCNSPKITSTASTDPNEATSPRTPLVQLPSQGQVMAAAASATTGTDRPSSASSTSIDGLVLAFVSSPDTELVHCVDVTLRCHAPPSLPPSGVVESSATANEWEDLDGWRGYFSPFAITTSTTTTSSSATGNTSAASATATASTSASMARVVGLAACRTSEGRLHMACLSSSETNYLTVWEDPHLYLSCRRPITSPQPQSDAVTYALLHPPATTEGHGLVVDIKPGIVAVGMDSGAVLVFVYGGESTKANRHHLRAYLRIPPPPTEGVEVVSVKLAVGNERASVFCSYRLQTDAITSASSTGNNPSPPSAGVCCYELPLPTKINSTTSMLAAPSARHDLDGRYVSSFGLVDAVALSDDSSRGGDSGGVIAVARLDGLYTYSKTDRIGVAPIDGIKRTFCLIPPPVPAEATTRSAPVSSSSSTSSTNLALVASTDAKSGRDAVDIYDSMNKLVAFHLLLSPGHKAIRAGAVATSPTIFPDGSLRGGRSTALVLTSGGSLITLTEKLTEEKISLLVQKNLYSAAIVVAYSDPATDAAVITSLYRQYAEHLYRKGDFSGAIDQYCHTIGSLESSHVIFRYLDAPKIPLLVKYLEKLRSRGLATQVHNELLRTCYLKLNDTEAADAIAASATSSINKASVASILSNLSTNPKEALATICSLPAQQAAEILVVHGASLARALPRETAGVVVALCLGTYSPKALAEAALIDPAAVKRMIERGTDDRPRVHEPYPFHLFAASFLENPKMLRLILTHCNRNKCYLTPSLRRTLLELTLAEWKQAKQSGDAEAGKMRHKEALASLTDSHCRDIGDYDALVIVQQSEFEEGELLLYERLQMTPMLLERYAKDGSEKSRRQMLAMSQSNAEVLADVLGRFVQIASEKFGEQQNQDIGGDGDESDDDEDDAILDDIREALSIARLQGVLPPVRVTRILAGEGTGQFSAENPQDTVPNRRTVPLSVALDYVGTILEESRKEITRLRSEVEEYNQLCNTMHSEIDSLLRASFALPAVNQGQSSHNARLSIDDLYAKVRSDDVSLKDQATEPPLEAFWRDLAQAEDTFDTIARYFAKGVIR